MREYIKELNRIYADGDATEHSYRLALINLIKRISSDTTLINEAQRIQCGQPDITIKRNNLPVGYIETKDVDTDLDKLQGYEKEQQERYLRGLSNLVYTDYINFIFYVDGIEAERIRIAKVSGNKIAGISDNYEKFQELVKNTCARNQQIKSADKLAEIMAGKAKLIRNVLYDLLINGKTTSLRVQLECFRQTLIHDLDETRFADIYAQTITYGFFVARLNDDTPETFSRLEAAELVSKNNPFLQHLFTYISGANIDECLIWLIDDLVNLFKNVVPSTLLRPENINVSLVDPFIHFYETFLNYYDKTETKKRGVVYTPLPVVRFIIKNVDYVLKNEFWLNNGLIDTSEISYKSKLPWSRKGKASFNTLQMHKVQILDPATGTGSFLAELIKYMYKAFRDKQSLWNNFVDSALFDKIYGFELLMTPYAICHLKLNGVLKETGIKATNKRFQIYLTNTLESSQNIGQIPFAEWLTDEAQQAQTVKTDTPIMVIMGNPPYKGESANGHLYTNELKEYKKGLNEKNPKWINNDYVKFIRFAQQMVEKNKEGIVAYITDNGYLNNPTFRCMRHSLLKTFNKIYILNLHGHVLDKECDPNGTKDENIFNIKQGVCIAIFIKNQKSKSLAKVHYVDIYGTKEHKFECLNTLTLDSVEFEDLRLKSPDYLFVPQPQEKTKKSFKLNDLFLEASSCVTTLKGQFAIDYSIDELNTKLYTLFEAPIADAENVLHDYLNNKFNIRNIRKETKYQSKAIYPLSYRVFDDRFIYYHKTLLERDRKKIMENFLSKGNLGLIYRRQQLENNQSFYFLTKHITSDGFIRSDSSGSEVVAPLYIYKPKDLLNNKDYREHNLNMDIVQELKQKMNLTFTPEKENTKGTFAPIDILDYIYGVLYSQRYREKYKDLLKIDFPRIPYPKNSEYFFKIAKHGEKLRKLHLLEDLNIDLLHYPDEGDNMIGEVKYKDGNVYINKTQSIRNVPEIAWDFYIGGYQPAQKWLKDRKGKFFTQEDLEHYSKIIHALTETHNIMQEIDEIIEL